MKLVDLLENGLGALWRQKIRTCLMIAGVAVGTFALCASIGLGIGVRKIIDDNAKRTRELRDILVFPDSQIPASSEGIPKEEIQVDPKVPPERAQRIRRKLENEWRIRNGQQRFKPLSEEDRLQILQIPHVVAVTPNMGEVVTLQDKKVIQSFYLTTAPEDRIEKSLIFGRPFSSPEAEEIILNEFLLYKVGIRSDSEIQSMLGQPLMIELSGNDKMPEWNLIVTANQNGVNSNLTPEQKKALEKINQMLPKIVPLLPIEATEKEALSSLMQSNLQKGPTKIIPTMQKKFTLVGVIKSPEPSAKIGTDSLTGIDAQGVIPEKTAFEIFRKTARFERNGWEGFTVTVDSEENLYEVTQALTEKGYRSFSIGLLMMNVRKNITLFGFTMDFVALVALAVAGIGITNTTLAAVLERTKEIGILKAVGAKDRDIMIMFQTEAILVGLLGGSLGVVFAWLSSLLGDNYALKLIAQQEPNMPTPETVFRFPIWLVLGTPLLACIVAVIATWFPARRASRLHPVEALRYE
ncbi:MAG: ABC transporter permease [Gemmataceae bacterium]|nr:ABC transporter permease [Gemmataceae bacterium]